MRDRGRRQRAGRRRRRVRPHPLRPRRGHRRPAPQASALTLIHPQPAGVPPCTPLSPRPTAGVLTDMFTAFPDLRWTLRDTIAEDDRIMTLGTWTGTHRAPFLGIPATGRTVTVESWTLDRYRDGRLAESRIIMDVAGMLTQLGLIPAPAA